jgi:hypothetical protein
MAQTSYPFDAQDTTEAQYSQLFRRLTFTGVIGAPAGSELKPFGDSSGMSVKVPAGNAIVRGHFYKSDAQETLTITASSTNPRRDLVVLRLDPSANSIVLAVKAGTPASSPSDPSLTQTDEGIFELALARVTVPANAVTISASDVTDLRTYIGQQLGLWTTAQRPSAPTVGTAGFNVTTGSVESWNGTAWKTVQFSDDALTASRLSATEQASLNAGRIRAGGTSSGAATTIFVQSGTPTANAVGDLWFWGA